MANNQEQFNAFHDTINATQSRDVYKRQGKWKM